MFILFILSMQLKSDPEDQRSRELDRSDMNLYFLSD